MAPKLWRVGTPNIVDNAITTAKIAADAAVCRWRGALHSEPSNPVEGDIYWFIDASAFFIYADSAWRPMGIA